MRTIENLMNTKYPVIRHIGIMKNNAKIMYDELKKQFIDRTIVICGIGTSGAMIMTSLLSEAADRGDSFECLLLAKVGESEHRNTYSGSFNDITDLNKPVIVIVDDIIASGGTMSNISELLIAYGVLDYVEAVCASGSINRSEKLTKIFPNLNFCQA